MQAEVLALEKVGSIKEEVRFPEGQLFAYILQVGSAVSASFRNNEITVCIPLEQSKHWIASKELSLRYSLPLQDGEQLSLLIEKDLACLTEREGEDDSDAFPNPKKAC